MKVWIHSIIRFSDFSGRSSRKELWQYYLWNYILSFILGLVDLIIRDYILLFQWGSYLSLTFIILTLLPSISMAIRRLHDIGRSGWFLLVPIYGPLVILFKKGDITANKYGPPTIIVESGKNDIRS